MKTIQVTPAIAKVLESMMFPTTVNVYGEIKTVDYITITYDGTLLNLCVNTHKAEDWKEHAIESWDIEPEQAKELIESESEKSIEYKKNPDKTKLVVRTKGFVFPESKRIRINYLQADANPFNVYTMTEKTFWKIVKGNEHLIYEFEWDYSHGMVDKEFQRFAHNQYA